MIKMTIKPVVINGVALPPQGPNNGAVKFFKKAYEVEFALKEMDRNWKQNACGNLGGLWGTVGMSCTITKGNTTYQVDVEEIKDDE